MLVAGTGKVSSEVTVEENIRQQADESIQEECDTSGDQANGGRQE